MTDISNPPMPDLNRIELAIPVAQRVQIRDVFLVACSASRSPKAGKVVRNHAMSVNIKDVRFAKDDEAKRLLVSPSFVLRVKAEAEAEAESASSVAEEADLSIEATFMLFYSVDSFEGLDDEHLEGFSLTNGVFNAWPYWREFVQNMTSRMGIRAITIPVFRVDDMVSGTDEPTSKGATEE